MNKAAEELLMKQLQTRSTRTSTTAAAFRSAKRADLACFKKPNVDVIRSFVVVRKFANCEAAKGFKVKKGSLTAPEGEANLFNEAFAVRADPVILEAPADAAPAAQAALPAPTTSHAAVGGAGGGGAAAADNSQAASALLENRAWVALITKHLKGNVETRPDTSLPRMAEADALAAAMEGRLSSHLEERVEDKQKHGHGAWQFFLDNKERFAATSASWRQVKGNTSFVAADASLFTPDISRFIPVQGATGQLEGAYGHLDKVDQQFKRAGKAVGATRNFAVRDKDHKKGAMLATLGALASLFYMSYPSRDPSVALRINKRLQRGHFEDLQQCVLLGFDRRTDRAAVKKAITAKDNGIFVWSDATMAMIEKWDCKGASLEDKQLHMVGYAAELFYDLMIAKADNVSRSPGFESIVGVVVGGGL